MFIMYLPKNLADKNKIKAHIKNILNNLANPAIEVITIKIDSPIVVENDSLSTISRPSNNLNNFNVRLPIAILSSKISRRTISVNAKPLKNSVITNKSMQAAVSKNNNTFPLANHINVTQINNDAQ